MDSNPRSPARETTLRDCLLIEEVRFALDSPLEGDGFELPVPRRWNNDSRRLRSTFWQADRGVRRPTNGREEQAEFGELHATLLATGINCGHRLSSG